MKQEAGILEPMEGQINFEDYPMGKVLYLFPYHASTRVLLLHLFKRKPSSPKLPECLFIVSYVVGIDTVVKRHHSQ